MDVQFQEENSFERRVAATTASRKTLDPKRKKFLIGIIVVSLLVMAAGLYVSATSTKGLPDDFDPYSVKIPTTP